MKHKNTAYISREALSDNYRAIEEMVSQGEHRPVVIAIVKADAYGHGVEDCATILGGCGCTFFGVSSEEEAHELRKIEEKNGRHPEILILSRISPDNVPDMIRDDVTVALVSEENARELSEAVRAYRAESGEAVRLKVHIKLDTGMNRVGFAADEENLVSTVDQLCRVNGDDAFSIGGIFTHFSSADDELLTGKAVRGYSVGEFTGMQLDRFKRALAALEARGVNVGIRHAANSAAILRLPEAYFDAVRAGIIIYGLTPDGKVDPRLSPVMQMDSTVTHIHVAPIHSRVSYGATYNIDKPTLVATVAAGYADGFERAYGGCKVKIGGKLYPQIGRICMDQFMVDITPENGDITSSPVKIGDPVTLFGGDDGKMANELAKVAGTISYEVVCKVSKRVKRELV